jgi:hypothetical protein
MRPASASHTALRGRLVARCEREGLTGNRLALAFAWWSACALLLALAAAQARAQQSGAPATEAPSVPAAYRLTGFVPSQPLDLGVPDTALSRAPEFFYRLPSSFTYDSLSGVNLDGLGGLDPARATLRYTWLAHPSWAMKIGLSTPLEPDSTWQRLLVAAGDRPRLGLSPAMHLSGESQLSEHWMLSLDAEGQRWSRGQSVDMDLRINYHLTPGLALFGSYRLTDSFGEAYENIGFPVSNTARFGLRLSF